MATVSPYNYSLQHTLEGDLRRMLGDPSSHDIVFLCGSTMEELPACKLLVAARSTVLETMLLTGGMAEVQSSRIPLPDIDVSTMQICLEFLYTDTVKSSSWPPGLEPAVLVINAARFFFVRRLERIALCHLERAMFRMQDRYIKVAQMVDIAKAYSAICRNHYEDDLEYDWCTVIKLLTTCLNKYRQRSRLKVYAHLSEEALFGMIDSLEFTAVNESFPMTGYIRFVHLVWWISSQIPSYRPDEVVEFTLRSCLPWRISSLCDLLDARSPPLDLQHTNGAGFLKLLAEHIKGRLGQFHKLHMWTIPRSVLGEVIEPLNIIPRQVLTEVYRIQASKDKLGVRWHESAHGDTYTIDSGDPTVISCNSDRLKGLAACAMFASTSNMVSFHWEVVVLMPCEQLRVGLSWGMGFKAYRMDAPLGEQRNSFALSADGTLKCEGRTSFEEKFCDAFEVKEGLSMGMHFCSKNFKFSINGRLIPGTLTLNCPAYSWLFCAVSMQRPGKVRIQTCTADWDLWRDKFKRAGVHLETPSWRLH